METNYRYELFLCGTFRTGHVSIKRDATEKEIRAAILKDVLRKDGRASWVFG